MSKATEKSNPGISIKKYRHLKDRLIRLERFNHSTINLIPCSGNEGWYELAEISAIIYYYVVCPKLDVKVKFYADDTSYYERYELGYIRARYVDVVRDRLKQANLYQSETKIDGGIWVFKLNVTLEISEIERYIEAEKKRRAVNLLPMDANNLDPKLHQLIVACATRLHQICNSRLDKLSSQTNGHRIVTLIDSTLTEYHQISAMPNISDARLIEKLENMRRNIYKLIIEIQLLGETRLWNLELCASVSPTLCAIRDRIETNLKSIMRRAKNGSH